MNTGGAPNTGGGQDTGGAPDMGGNPSTGVDAQGGTSVGQGGTALAQAGSTALPPADPTASVTLTPGTTYQTLEGFGAALAWYQGTLTGHSKSAELYKILFDDLGLDIIRFRNTFGRTDFASAAKDKTILDAATSSLGRRPKVLMSSWSPPASIKANSVEKCSGETTCTLKQINGAYQYDEFATYWGDALAAYANLGIAPDWISIQNEPDFIPNGWEGCKFVVTESTSFPGYGKALAAVATKLASVPGAPRLVGPETLGIHYNKLQNYLPALDTSLLAAVAHHLYEQGGDGIWDWRSPGPDSFLNVMKGAKSAAGSLPIFQTEFQTDSDNEIEGGFETAWLIHNSVVEEGVSAWLYWDLVWGAGGGLVSLPNSSDYSIRDQYYSVRHFARYTDPGYVRIGATATSSNLRVSAFQAPDRARVTVVVLNVGASEERIHLDLGFSARSSDVYRTTYVPGGSTRWETQQTVVDGALLTLPSRSIATIVLVQ
jgi:glucuronoarabinoxylan endo-1,4-beta-xylanase